MEKPEIGGTSPIRCTLEVGKKYAYCTCGKSDGQPWCNGAHKGTPFTPMVFTQEAEKTACICTCKMTSNPPYCDGSHKSLAE